MWMILFLTALTVAIMPAKALYAQGVCAYDTICLLPEGEDFDDHFGIVIRPEEPAPHGYLEQVHRLYPGVNIDPYTGFETPVCILELTAQELELGEGIPYDQTMSPLVLHDDGVSLFPLSEIIQMIEEEGCTWRDPDPVAIPLATGSLFCDTVQYILMYNIPRYVTLQKEVGQTPLQCTQRWRATQSPAYQNLPLAYAGRLDPMASGKLLVLIGEECKKQERYHALDKRYEFSVLLGIASDTADVLGRLSGFGKEASQHISLATISKVLTTLTGPITLPYPHFSAKTVQGKPLHMWTLEGRLGEIIIPTQTSTVYKLSCTQIETKSREQIYQEAMTKINSIPPVTDERKALGNDFRRVDVRADWKEFRNTGNSDDTLSIIHIACTASSGTYMRSLAEEIGRRLGNIPSLAYHIHRTHIGHYHPLTSKFGIWTKKF